MPTYKIPITWKMQGIILIDADDAEEALDNFDKGLEFGLPDGDLVENSVEYDESELIELSLDSIDD